MRKAAARRAAARMASAAGAGVPLRKAAAQALFRELRAAWDCWYEAFYLDDGKEAPAAPLRFTRGAVLDLGCGDGTLALSLAEGCRSVTAADVSKRALAMAKKRLAGIPNARTALIKGWELPFADGSFDGAVCRRTLSHFDVEAAVLVLSELRRVLRPAGLLVFDLPNFHHPAYLDALARPGSGNWPAACRPRYWTAAMLRALLPRLGFVVDGVRPGAWLSVRARRGTPRRTPRP